MGIRRIVIPYKPRLLQAQIHHALKRWSVLVCHRRFGKSVLAVNHLIKAAIKCDKSRPRVAYIAPLFKQAKQIAWDYVRHYARPIPGVTFNESELRADLPNGGRISLFGADNPDALRGIYLDAVVLDEVAQVDPRLFPEIIRPALVDRQGSALFIGTPFGKNHFYDLFEYAKSNPEWYAAMFRASETGIIPQAELDAARETLSPEQYAQEFECSFESAVIGAYYAQALTQAQEQGRIGRVPWEPGLPVSTAWDLGIGDATAIWFLQRLGKETRVIDYLETAGEGMPYFAKALKEKPYTYDRHFMPHDADHKHLQTGKSTRDIAENLGVRPIDVVRRSGNVINDINTTRLFLAGCWFDEEKTRDGLNALKNYRKEWDDNRRTFKDNPYHDWSSHAADALRTAAMSDWGRDFGKPIKVETQFDPWKSDNYSVRVDSQFTV